MVSGLNHAMHKMQERSMLDKAITKAGFDPDDVARWTNEELTTNMAKIFPDLYESANCPSSAVINVPKNPENFIWTFPYGCYDSCVRNERYVSGSIAPMATWSWNFNNSPVFSGTGVMQPLLLNNSGDYSMTLNTGFCDLESKKLSFSEQGCRKCDVLYSILSNVSNNQGFCESTLTISANNLTNFPITVSFSSLNSQVFVNPVPWVLNPGSNNLTVNLIPINGFLGGPIDLVLNGLDSNNVKCFDMLPINVPSCNEFFIEERKLSSGSTALKSKFSLSPNPTNSLVSINFENTSSTATIEIYDLLGKKIAAKQCNTAKGTWDFDSTAMAQGVYIVVFKNENEILSQQKLIKN